VRPAVLELDRAALHDVPLPQEEAPGEALVKAITLTQPYAAAIATIYKRCIVKTFPFNYRGLLAIHAGRRWDLPEIVKARFLADIAGQDEDYFTDRARPANTIGAVVAVAKLVRIEEIDADMVRELNIMEHEFGPFDEWKPGRFAWHVDDVRALRRPVFMRGQPGIYDLTLDQRIAVKRAAGLR